MNCLSAAKTKAEGLGWIAVAVAPRKGQLAHRLIEKSMAVYADPAMEGEFLSWSNFGGRSVFAAFLVTQANRVGYPQMGTLIDRELAMRPSTNVFSSPLERIAASIRVAKLLALVDAGCARELLECVAPKDETPRGAAAVLENFELSQAWALADIDYMACIIDSHAKISGKDNPWTNGLIAVFELLTTPSAERAEALLRYRGGFWFPGAE